jgi:hypothetical protein
MSLVRSIGMLVASRSLRRVPTHCAGTQGNPSPTAALGLPPGLDRHAVHELFIDLNHHLKSRPAAPWTLAKTGPS